MVGFVGQGTDKEAGSPGLVPRRINWRNIGGTGSDDVLKMGRSSRKSADEW